MNPGETSQQWRQFLHRNKEFASNREKALEHKRKAKQEELDKACTFAPKVHDWNLKIEEGDGESCSAETSTTCSEFARPDILVTSQMERLEVDTKCALDIDGPSQGRVIQEKGAEESAVDVGSQNQVSDTLPSYKLPLEAWSVGEENVAVEANPGPARLSCSPCGKLVVSNLASEVTLHDAWPRAKLLFADCDDTCEKQHPNVAFVSATASTEVSNCPSEAGGPDNEEDEDLDTLVANLRSHKVYSFHFSG
jgi:hypothetical protein